MTSFMLPATQQYLVERGAEVIRLENSSQKLRTRHDNTSKEPHTCRHCQTITIDLRRSGERIRLDYDIGKAIAAAQEGCPLYQVVVDIAAKGKATEGKGRDENFDNYRDLVLSYTFNIREETQSSSSATLRFSVLGQLDDGSEKRVTGGLVSGPLFYDNTASDIIARPYESDFTSRASVQFAKNCLRLCQSEHTDCRSPAFHSLDEPERIKPDHIPSRLLRITNEAGGLGVELVGKDSYNELDTHLVSKQGYAILSYCWGGPQPIELTRSNVHKLSSGIPASSLPRTIRDAVWYTSAIDIEYLWVDALCIFQDDVHDKVLEISRMAEYYTESTVTICAASAVRCSEGFLQPRQEVPSAYSIGPIQLQAITTSGAKGYIQVMEENDSELRPYDEYNRKRPEEPTTLRGWTLQESLLSRRILIFSSSRLVFTCAVSNATCGGPAIKPIDRVTSSYTSPVIGIHTLSGLRFYPVRIIWQKVVEEYTTRQLSFSPDKLPAVSAMASVVTAMAKERGQSITYLAGLIMDMEDDFEWRAQLLWMSCVVDDMREVGPRGPSWTWSSLDGPIMIWGWSQPRDWDESNETRLLDHSVRLQSNVAPFGEVLDGSIRVRARSRALDTIMDNVKLVRKRKWKLERFYPETCTILLSPDTKEREQIINRALQGQHFVALLELVPYSARQTSPAGLIITRSSSDKDSYVRLGMFEYERRDLKHIDHKEPEAEQILRASLFTDSPFQDVTLE
ncbi:HET-domain-containing protein [Hypomontagnella monticulosa]|nr:HET-domain-containing protein [Hypomontagnella monticulosa]